MKRQASWSAEQKEKKSGLQMTITLQSNIQMQASEII